jgi:hypothetical protein
VNYVNVERAADSVASGRLARHLDSEIEYSEEELAEAYEVYLDGVILGPDEKPDTYEEFCETYERKVDDSVDYEPGYDDFD